MEGTAQIMDDILPHILEAYCAPTRVAGGDWAGSSLLEQSMSIAQDASFVSKKWRKHGLLAQRTAVKAMREAFFAKVLECVQRKCLDPAWSGRTNKCVLRQPGVTTTVVGITVHKDWLLPLCSVYMLHYPVDAEQKQVTCMQKTPTGWARPPHDFNMQETHFRLKEMPHFRVHASARSEEEMNEAQAWLDASLSVDVLEGLRQDFAALNERDWHRQRFRV